MAPHIFYIDLPQELPIPLLGHLPEYVENVPLLNRIFVPGHAPSLKLFGLLVATGVYLGSVVAMRHARERRLDQKKVSEFIFWVVGIGFIGAHVLDAIFYHPAAVEKNPFYIFMLWEGISSYGGFIGAVTGAVLWRYSRKQKILNMCECLNSAFPLAWVFGRMGCSSVHDHPGIVSQAWIAVKYPGLPPGWGRYDLGLYELFLTIPLAAAFLLLWRKRPDRPPGFYTGIMCVYYAPIRFFLDFLRETEGDVGGDPRYGGLTPAQWACFGLLGVGVYFLRMARKGGSSLEPEVAAAPKIEAEEDDEDESDEDADEAEPAPVPKKRRRKPA